MQKRVARLKVNEKMATPISTLCHLRSPTLRFFSHSIIAVSDKSCLAALYNIELYDIGLNDSAKGGGGRLRYRSLLEHFLRDLVRILQVILQGR